MATSSVASASRLCLADLFTSYPNLSAGAAAALFAPFFVLARFPLWLTRKA
jgi:hypothetical protein